MILWFLLFLFDGLCIININYFNRLKAPIPKMKQKLSLQRDTFDTNHCVLCSLIRITASCLVCVLFIIVGLNSGPSAVLSSIA